MIFTCVGLSYTAKNHFMIWNRISHMMIRKRPMGRIIFVPENSKKIKNYINLNRLMWWSKTVPWDGTPSSSQRWSWSYYGMEENVPYDELKTSHEMISYPWWFWFFWFFLGRKKFVTFFLGRKNFVPWDEHKSSSWVRNPNFLGWLITTPCDELNSSHETINYHPLSFWQFLMKTVPWDEKKSSHDPSSHGMIE